MHLLFLVNNLQKNPTHKIFKFAYNKGPTLQKKVHS